MSFVGLLFDETDVLMDGKGRRGRDVGKLRPGRPEDVLRVGRPNAGEAARGEETEGRDEIRVAIRDASRSIQIQQGRVE